MTPKPTYAELEKELVERDRVEEALRESELKYRTLFESSELLTYITDSKGKILLANTKGAAFLGLARETIIGKSFFELRPDRAKMYQDVIDKVLLMGRTLQFETLYPTPEEDKWLFVTVTPLKTKSDLQLQIITQDITQRKQAEEALRESENRYSTLAEASFEGVLIHEKGIVLDANNRFAEMFGLSVAELMKINAFELIAPEHRDEVRKRGAAEDERPYESLGLRKDLSTFPMEIRAAHMLYKGRNARVAVVHDITDRKRAEEGLRESEEKYRLLIKNLPCIVCRGYKDWSVEFIDNKVEVLTGYNVDEFNSRKMKWSDVVFKEDFKAARQSFIKALKTDKSYIREYRIRSKAGSIIWIQERGYIVCDSQGEIEYISSVFFDVTATKKLQSQVQQSQKMESIGTLAGGIAHDFNNILSAVIGYTEIALDETDPDTSLYKNLQQVLKAGERASDLVQQILTFSRQTDQELKPIQVKVIIKEVLKLLRATLPATIEIKLDISSEFAVLADPTQIHQVLMNICANAGHAMQEKGGTLGISLNNVELDSYFMAKHPEIKPGPYLQLTISDTGHGMLPEVLERIFDPFFTTKEKGEGTGMGLAVVHGIVKSHSGTITAYSDPGKGSTFNIYLPVIREDPASEIRKKELLPTGTEHLLLVDDEEAIVNSEKQALESLGYRVVAKTSSIEALELFKAQKDRFDLVITDMTMPQMTGENLAKELMKIKPDIPVILCTGFSTKIDEKKAMAMGIRAFVLKPISKQKIAGVIRAVLDG